MTYTVEFTAYCTMEVEADDIEDAKRKAYDNVDMRDFEIENADVYFSLLR